MSVKTKLLIHPCLPGIPGIRAHYTYAFVMISNLWKQQVMRFAPQVGRLAMTGGLCLAENSYLLKKKSK